MATINSREMVDTIIANYGIYPGDSIRVIKIVAYVSNWNTSCYGLIYEGESRDRYAESDFVHSPQVLWEYKL